MKPINGKPLRAVLLLASLLFASAVMSSPAAFGQATSATVYVALVKRAAISNSDSVPFDAPLNGVFEWGSWLSNDGKDGFIINPHLTVATPYNVTSNPALTSSEAREGLRYLYWVFPSVAPQNFDAADVYLSNGPTVTFSPGYTSEIITSPSTIATDRAVQTVTVIFTPHVKFSRFFVDINYGKPSTTSTPTSFVSALPKLTPPDSYSKSNQVYWSTQDPGVHPYNMTAQFLVENRNFPNPILHKPEVDVTAVIDGEQTTLSGNTANKTLSYGLGSIAYSATGNYEWTISPRTRYIVSYKEWVARVYQENLNGITTLPPGYFPPIGAQTGAGNITQSFPLGLSGQGLMLLLAGAVAVIGVIALMLRRRRRPPEDKTRVY